MQTRHPVAARTSHSAHRRRQRLRRVSAMLLRSLDRSPAKLRARRSGHPLKLRSFLGNYQAPSSHCPYMSTHPARWKRAFLRNSCSYPHLLLVLSHDLYFCFQFDPALRTGHVFDLLNQLEHVRRCRAPVINNEIAVPSDTRAFPTHKFLSPNSSTSFPAGHESGFLKMQPALLAAGCDVRRFSCDASSLRTISSSGAGWPRKTADTAKFFSSNGKLR